MRGAPSTEPHDPNRYVRGRDPRRVARARRGPHRCPGPPTLRVLVVGVPAPGENTPAADARPYVEGALGVPLSVTPLTARTQVDRDLVALLFSGLVRNGPGGTIVPDLAERWSVDATGKTWTVDLRDDATLARRRARHRRRRHLHHPDPAGPGLHRPVVHVVERGRGHVVRPATRGVLAADAARWVPAGADPADRAGAPPGRRPDRGARRQPVRAAARRLGAVRAGRADGHIGVAGPGRRHRPGRGRRIARPVRGGHRRFARQPAPTTRPTRPRPYLAGIDIPLLHRPGQAGRRLPRGRPRRASRASRASSRRSSAPIRGTACCATRARP